MIADVIGDRDRTGNRGSDSGSDLGSGIADRDRTGNRGSDSGSHLGSGIADRMISDLRSGIGPRIGDRTSDLGAAEIGNWIGDQRSARKTRSRQESKAPDRTRAERNTALKLTKVVQLEQIRRTKLTNVV